MAERRSPSAARAAAPVALLAGTTLGIAMLQAVPRGGEPLLLLFPPGLAEAAALGGVLAAPGWNPVSLSRLGPFAAAIAAPDGPDASAAALRRTSGAWIALPAFGWGGCNSPRGLRGPGAAFTG